MTRSRDSSSDDAPRRLTAEARARAIEELKRRGKESWGATYYSQMAPPDLCRLAGRPRPVQYGALISWVKRLGGPGRSHPSGAIDLVAHLVGASPEDVVVLGSPGESDDVAPTPLRRSQGGATRDGDLVVNCPSVVHDHRFVVVGELPDEDLFPAVLLQPLDGSGYWYPQVAQHNPLRAGRAFACLVRLGNPSGIWHTKKPPLDARVRVVALRKKWERQRAERMQDDVLGRRLSELGLVAEKEASVSRVAVDLLEPTLTDRGRFAQAPLRLEEPRAESCVSPLRLEWRGGAAHIEIREGKGDRVVFQGTAAPGATLTVRGGQAPVDDADVLFQLDQAGPYRLRLYPTVWSFVDPPYEWWLDIV